MKIPKQIYFIHYDNKEIGKPDNFLFIDAMCIKSAIINNPNYKVNLITNNPNLLDEYEDIKNNVNIIVEKPIKEIFNIKITCIQHCADIRRVQLLITLGGVFLDTDILVVKPFKCIEDNDCDLIVGSETKKRLGIAFIAAVPDLDIFKKWLNNYKNFEGYKFEGYNEKDATVNIKKFKTKEEKENQLNYYLKDSTYLFNKLVLEDLNLNILKLPKKITFYPTSFNLDLKEFYKGNGDIYKDSIFHHLWRSMELKTLSKVKDNLNNSGYFYKKIKEIYETNI